MMTLPSFPETLPDAACAKPDACGLSRAWTQDRQPGFEDLQSPAPMPKPSDDQDMLANKPADQVAETTQETGHLAHKGEEQLEKASKSVSPTSEKLEEAPELGWPTSEKLEEAAE